MTACITPAGQRTLRNSGEARQRVTMPVMKRAAVVPVVLAIPLLLTRQPLHADGPLRLSSVTREDPLGPAAQALLQRHPVPHDLHPQTAAIAIAMPQPL